MSWYLKFLIALEARKTPTKGRGRYLFTYTVGVARNFKNVVLRNLILSDEQNIDSSAHLTAPARHYGCGKVGEQCMMVGAVGVDAVTQCMEVGRKLKDSYGVGVTIRGSRPGTALRKLLRDLTF